MFYRNITVARVRMLALMCLMLLAVFGQVGAERTAECFTCERAVCPDAPGACTPGRFGRCTCFRNGAIALCVDNAKQEK